MGVAINIFNLPASITIKNAATLRDELLDRIKKNDSLMVDLSLTVEVDVAGIQLLYAAMKYAEIKKKDFSFTGLVTEELEIALMTGGFCTVVPSDGKSLVKALKGQSNE
ncbi:MAG: STAS domain-containing protein [Spirochaetaceae bacterium]|nr:MAG: STAS domain-containing protein [Spirochaetaceae bacterium]